MSSTLQIERELYFPGDVLRTKVTLNGIGTLGHGGQRTVQGEQSLAAPV